MLGDDVKFLFALEKYIIWNNDSDWVRRFQTVTLNDGKLSSNVLKFLLCMQPCWIVLINQVAYLFHNKVVIFIFHILAIYSKG